jgi:hypothetical protein
MEQRGNETGYGVRNEPNHQNVLCSFSLILSTALPLLGRTRRRRVEYRQSNVDGGVWWRRYHHHQEQLFPWRT